MLSLWDNIDLPRNHFIALIFLVILASFGWIWELAIFGIFLYLGTGYIFYLFQKVAVPFGWYQLREDFWFVAKNMIFLTRAFREAISMSN